MIGKVHGKMEEAQKYLEIAVTEANKAARYAKKAAILSIVSSLFLVITVIAQLVK